MLQRLLLSARAIALGAGIGLIGSGIFGCTLLLCLMAILRRGNAMEHFAAHIQGTGVMLGLLAGWMLFSIVGGYAGARPAKDRKIIHALITGAVSLGIGFALYAFCGIVKYPVWFWPAAAVLVLSMSVLGGYVAGEMEGKEPGMGIKWDSVPNWVVPGIGALLVLAGTAYCAASWKVIGTVHAHYAGKAKGVHGGSSRNAVARLMSRFEGVFTGGNDGKKLVISPDKSKIQAIDCLALPVQDAQGLIWCIRKDRPSDLACWDGGQWRFTELKDIAADPRGPAGAVILADDKKRVHVISARGQAGFDPAEIDVAALQDEYRQDEHLFVDKYLFNAIGRKNASSRGQQFAYRISTLSPEEIRGIFNSMLSRHDLCSMVDIQRLGLGSSYLIQKVRLCDYNSSADMIATANRLLLSRMYPRTFAKAFREKAYRVEGSSVSVVKTFSDAQSMLTDAVRSGSRSFRANTGQPPLVYNKKIIYDGKCFGSDTLTIVYLGKDTRLGTWQDGIVAVQFGRAAGAAGDAPGAASPSKCMLCGAMTGGRMQVVYEDSGGQQKRPGRAVSAAMLAGNAKLPENRDRIYPFKGGFSYFDPAAGSIVLCSSGGKMAEIKMNEGLIGRAGIQVFDPAVYEKNRDALFPVRKSGDDTLVFASLDDFNLPSSTGAVQAKAVKLPGYIKKLYPVPGGFAVNDHRAGKITVYVKDRVLETAADFYAANQLNEKTALFADAKGNLWITAEGRILEIPREEVFPQ